MDYSNLFIPLVMLVAIELVLGIDNIIFLALILNKVPETYRNKLRYIGLFLAMFMRIGLLFSLSWLTNFTAVFATIGDFNISGRSLVLLLGGLFLIIKATAEIHETVSTIANNGSKQVTADRVSVAVTKKTMSYILLQIVVMDIVFSLDSVITAIGLVQHLWMMIVAIVMSIIVMLFASKWIIAFIDHNITFKILALAFLILIGLVLVADAFGLHIPRGYIYFAMSFSVGIELINMRLRVKPTR